MTLNWATRIDIMALITIKQQNVFTSVEAGDLITIPSSGYK